MKAHPIKLDLADRCTKCLAIQIKIAEIEEEDRRREKKRGKK